MFRSYFSFIQLAFFVKGLDVSVNPNDVHFYLYPDKWDKSKFVELKPDPRMSSFYYNHNWGHGHFPGPQHHHNRPSYWSPKTRAEMEDPWNHFRNYGLTVFIIHDFAMDSNFSEVQTIKNAYLASRIDGNIILVDWGPLSIPHGLGVGNSTNSTSPTTPALIALNDPKSDYQKVVDNVPIVGRRIAEFSLYLARYYTSHDSIHLIGHGLGAHIAGDAGRRFLYISSGNELYRITGLDPSAHLFNIPRPAMKLSTDTASFVDVIVTGAGFQGDATVQGHATFYPNGGAAQPACDDITTLGMCSHNYSISIYTASMFQPIVGCDCVRVMLNVGPMNLLSTCMVMCPNPTYLGPYCSERTRGHYLVWAGSLSLSSQ